MKMRYVFSVFLLSLKRPYIKLEEVTLKMRPRRALRRKDCVHSDCGSSDSRGLLPSAQVVKEQVAFPEAQMGPSGSTRTTEAFRHGLTHPDKPFLSPRTSQLG